MSEKYSLLGVPYFERAIEIRPDIQNAKHSNIFAASLSAVVNGTADRAYTDPEEFWERTYITGALKRLLDMIESVFSGESKNAVISLETPFGGGKTHALIAAYHKARQMEAEVVAFDGDAIDPRDDVPWEYMERVLTGNVELLEGTMAPGGDRIKKVLEGKKVLLLFDELTTYATKAYAKDRVLADQLKAFIHTLANVANELEGIFLIVTVPSSQMEAYSEAGAELRMEIEKAISRNSLQLKPVEDEEVYEVIRKRLFKHVDKKVAELVAEKVTGYLVEEKLLTPDEAVTYKKIFARSYPFMPDLIHIFRDRWGSMPMFQRTRSVLHLFSLILQSAMGEKLYFIRPADVKLKSPILDALLQYTGEHFSSVVTTDITGPTAGAKKVDVEDETMKSYKFGTALATTMFLYSFPQNLVKTSPPKEEEIFRGSIPEDLSVSPLTPWLKSYLKSLKNTLKFLADEGPYFTADINITNLAVEMKSQYPDEKVLPQIFEDLERHARACREVEAVVNRQGSVRIRDRFTVVAVFSEEEAKKIFEDIKSSGGHKNMVAFAVVDGGKWAELKDLAKLRMAWEHLKKAREYKHKAKIIAEKSREAKTRYENVLKSVFSKVLIPTADGWEAENIYYQSTGNPFTAVWQTLLTSSKVKEEISPQFLKYKLFEKEKAAKVSVILNIFATSLNYPKVKSLDVVKSAIKRGVDAGLFRIALEQSEDGFECTDSVEYIEPDDYVVLPEACREKEEPKVYSQQAETPSTAHAEERTEPIDIFKPPAAEETPKPSEQPAKEASQPKVYRIVIDDISDVSFLSAIGMIHRALNQKGIKASAILTVYGELPPEAKQIIQNNDWKIEEEPQG